MTFGEPGCFTFSHVHHSSLSVLHMSLRTRLDRYCMQRATTTDLPFSPSRSRSPTRAPPSSSTGPSPFHRPPGWQPPTALPHRPIILQIDLKPMQQLANRDPYYNILAPQVAGNLTTDEYDSLFQAYKVIYPDYAARHYVGEIKTMVVDIMAQRWSIFLNTTDLYLTVDTEKGNHMLDQPRHSIFNWYYPAWKTHQHLDAFTNRSTPALPIAPHTDTSDTGLVVRIQSIPRGHPFYSPTLVTVP